MNILNLTLRKEPFIEILEGRKKEEYREDKEFWANRFEGKEDFYTHILFRNGYSANVPEMLIECKKIQLEYWQYKNGTEDFVWVLKLGKILKTKYLKPYAKPIKRVIYEKPVVRELFHDIKDETNFKKSKVKAAQRKS